MRVRDGCPEACNSCRARAATPTPSTSPSTSPRPSVTPTCHNDGSYRFDGRRSCRWIQAEESRRVKLCSHNEVAEHCPVSCGTCCEDNREYTFHVDSELQPVGCEWLSTAPAGNYCDIWSQRMTVGDGCPKACNSCRTEATLSASPSKTPSSSTQESGSPPSSKYICRNSDSYRLNDRRTCNFVRESGDRRRLQLCGKSDVVKNCPVSCGECCEDDPDYVFSTDSGSQVGCEWLSTEPSSSSCDKWSNGQFVKNGCAKSCNYCPGSISSIATSFVSSLADLISSVKLIEEDQSPP